MGLLNNCRRILEWKSDILFDLKTNSTEKIELSIKALFPGAVEIRTDLRLEISIP